ncbi:uncharacterized protein LOC143516425 isoform X2 [Brachyhypopomus gauderio]|uniref:uncharacterized protein LOC143516425 isoform X2 n=1 Tax=Brachyhypopomus gauderio TaxID=698409 RepID=UPI004041F5AC
MDGKFPPWNTQGRHGEETAYNVSHECQGLDNTSSHYGEVTADGDYGESLFLHTMWPQRPPDKCPVRFNSGDVTESYGETTAAETREEYSFINNNVPAGISDVHASAHEEKQDLERGDSSNWTSVIKEALEMSNGMELEQDLSVDMCRTAVVYEEPETRVLDPVKQHFRPVDYLSTVQERERIKEDKDGTNMLSIESKHIHQTQIIQELYSSTDEESVSYKIHRGTECSTLGSHNATEVCSLEQHADTEQTFVSDLSKKPCVSDELGLMKFNMDEQTKNLQELASKVPSLQSDSGNEDGTFPSAAILLGLTPEHDSYNTGQAQACNDVCLGKCVDSQTKFTEEYFSKNDNATGPTSFNIPGNKLNVQVTQIKKLECDDQNLRHNVDQIGQLGNTWSKTNINLNKTELQNEKPAVSVSGLTLVEENWCSNETDEMGISKDQHCPSQSNVQTEKANALQTCVINSNSAEPSRACSSTSVSKLEDLVHNLYKMIPPTSTLASTEHHQTRRNSTNDIAIENEASNLPLGQEICPNNPSNAECILAQEAASSTDTLSADRRFQLVAKKNKAVKKKAGLYGYSKKTDIRFSPQQLHNMEHQEASVPSLLTADLNHSDEASPTQEAGNTAALSLSTLNKHDCDTRKNTRHSEQISKTRRSTRKTVVPVISVVPGNILELVEPCAYPVPVVSENVLLSQNPQNAQKRQKLPRKRKMLGSETLSEHGQKIDEQTSVSQAMNCDGTEMQVTHKSSSNLHSNGNLKILPIKKQDETEYKRVITDVPQATKRKQMKPKKMKIPPEENNKILETSCSSSIGSCESPNKKIHLQDETLFSSSKKMEVLNVNQSDSVAFLKEELINTEENKEIQSEINSEILLDNAVPVGEDKKILQTKKQRNKRALKIDDLTTFNQSHSPCEDSSLHMDSTSVMESNRSTITKKTQKRTKCAKKSNKKAMIASAVDAHTVGASQILLQSSAVLPVIQTGTINIVTSKVIPKKPRKNRVSEIKNESARTPTTTPAVPQHSSILPFVLETLQSRITSKAESSVKAKRQSKKSRKKESCSLSETTSLSVSTENTKTSKKSKRAKQQSETAKLSASHLSSLEQSNPASCTESQRSMKCIKSPSNKNVKCVKPQSNVAIPQETMDSEDAITCGVLSTSKGNGQKAQDHSDSQTDCKHNVAERLDNTPDLQLDFCIMKTSEEVLKCDSNKNVVKKKPKKSQKNTKNLGSVDPYLFTETVSPVKLEHVVRPMPEIKIEPENLCVTTKEVKNNLKKPKQQDSGPKKNPFIWNTGTKDMNLDSDCGSQSQVSDSLNKEVVSVKVTPPKEHSSDECGDLKRIKNSPQIKRRVGRPFKKKTLIKMAKLLAAIHESSENLTAQDLEKVPQNNVSKNIIKMEEIQTDLPMNTSRKSSSQKSSSHLSTTGSCSTNVSLALCEGPANLEETAPSLSLSTASLISGSEKKSVGRGRGRPPKKQRKSTILRAQITQSAQALAIDEAEKREYVPSEQPSKTKNKSRKSSITMKRDPKSKKNISISPVDCAVPPCQTTNLSPSVVSTEVKSTTPESLVKKKVGRPRKKRVLLKIAVNSSLETPLVEWNVSSPSNAVDLPLTVPTHSRRKSKKSKDKSSKLQLSNVRHSKRLAKVKGILKPDLRATNIKMSSHSQAVCQRNMKKAKKSSRAKGVPNKCNIHESLANQSSCDVIDEKVKNTDKESIGVSGTHFGHPLKISKNQEVQLVTRIPSLTRKRKLNSEISSIVESLSRNTKKKKRFDQKTIKQPSNVVAECLENPVLKTRSKAKITKCKQNELYSRETVDEQVQQKMSKSDKLLDLCEIPLETEMPSEVILRDDEKSSDFYADTSQTLLKSEKEGVHIALLTNSVPKLKNKNVKRRPRRKKTRHDKRKKEKVLSIKPNGGGAFELPQQASADNIGFHSGKIDGACCDTKIQEQESEKLQVDASVKISDQHKHELSVEAVGNDVTLEDTSRAKFVSEAISHQHSRVEAVDGFTQYYDEDYMAILNEDTRLAANKMEKKGSLSKGIAKKMITCKYCGRIFHHISAYTVHRRIHTGEKPYRCKHCGKRFTHLSKIKSHTKVHAQRTSLKCPCCTKEFSQKCDLVSHFKVHLQESTHKPGKSIQCKPSAPSINNKSLICEICGNSFPNQIKLKIHVREHRRENIPCCKVCGKTFQKVLHLVAHEKTHWPVKPYACSICGKGFNRLKALKTHSQGHTGDTPFSCCHCGHAFSDLSALRAHQASKLCIGKQQLNGTHSDIEGFLVSQGVDGQVNMPVFFKCQICKQLYQKWCQYTLHLLTHTSSPPYLCFSCGQSYEKDSEVSVHCKVCCHSSGEEVACGASLSDVLHGETPKLIYSQNNSQSNCSSLQTFTTKNYKNGSQSSVMQSEENSYIDYNTLPRTEQRASQPCHAMKDSSLLENVPLPNDDQLITDSSPASPSVMSCASSNNSLECIEISPSLWKFECPRCGQRFKRYRTLRAHVQTHAPGFKYVCGHCGQSFERWNRLWLHQRIHRVKSRCYSCSQCNLQFMFFSSYKDHMMTHAGERPFACPLCPQTFFHEEGLHAHQCAFHQLSKSLQCDVCAKSFSSLRNLVKHSLLHNGTISHQCLKCNISFTNNKILQEHLKMHNTHLGLPLPEIPSEPLTFPYSCKRCKACFSTGALLYAHQICHSSGSKSQVRSTYTDESTSLLGGSPHPCTGSITPPPSRSLISTLNLDAIPNDESLYTYPHPDKLYVTPSLSSIRLQVINLESEDEELQQMSSSGPVSPNVVVRSGLPEQRIWDSTQLCTETDTTDLPQASESPEPSHIQSPHVERIPPVHTETMTTNSQDNAIPNDLIWTDRFVQMSVFLEGPTTSVNTDGNGDQEENFKCSDCFEQLNSLEELHEHYFLHALGNKCVHINGTITLTKDNGDTVMPISLG